MYRRGKTGKNPRAFGSCGGYKQRSLQADSGQFAARGIGRVPASCPPGFQGRYTVQSGDTMFFIAQRFGVSLQALINANPQIPDPSVLFPGDVLCVPGAGAPPGGRVPASCPPGFQGRYTVQPGDTMFFIAQRFGVSLQALINANPQIPDPNVLFPGDVLCVPGGPPAGRVPASCPPGFGGRYTVQSGDSMFSIAQQCGVSLQALINANPHITDPNQLFPCDVLCVPCPQPGRVPTSCPPGFQAQYTVRPGDSMFSIAQLFGVSLQALINANPHITDPNQINPCDVLCVPCVSVRVSPCFPVPEEGGRVPKDCPKGFGGRYTVQAGDSIFSIAQQCGVSPQALIKANPHIHDPKKLQPCDVLCVPCPQRGRDPKDCPKGFEAQYTVRPGDSIFSIAQLFGVSVQDLIKANPHIHDPKKLNPCDVLCVPCVPVKVSPCFREPLLEGRVPTSCPQGFQGRYTVEAGDTMSAIAQRFGVSLQALINANPQITNPDELFPCDVLCVPCPQPGRVPAGCPPGFQGQYTVAPGDSMFTIAQRFGVSLQELINANPQIPDPNQLFPCDVLCVPCPASLTAVEVEEMEEEGEKKEIDL